MDKKVITLSAIGVIVAAGVGVNLYADQKLKNAYLMPEKISPLIKKQQMDFKMGLMSGDAQWTFRLNLDPCQPSKEIVVKGIDHIQRSWNGYHITSKINLDLHDNDLKEYKDFLGGKDLFTTDSTLNWLGNVNMKIQSPALERNKDDQQVVWQGLDGVLKFQNKNGQYQATNVDLQFPGLVIQDKSSYLKLEGIQFKTNQAWSEQELTSGQGEFLLRRMVIQNQKVSNIDFDNLSVKTDVNVRDKFSVIKAQWQLKQLQTNHQSFNNINFNFDMSDINTPALQQFFKVMNTNPTYSCNDQQEKEYQTALENQLLAIFRSGFSFSSKGNTIEFEQAKAGFDIQGKLNQNQIQNLRDTKSEFTQAMEYQVNAKFDKQFIRNMLRLTNPSQNLSPQETEQVISQIAQKMHGKINGNQVEMSASYQRGQLTYN